MLPQVGQLQFNNTNETVENPTESKDSFLFDFEKGDFITVDGKVVKATGIEALKMWIQMNIKTVKNRFRVYQDTDFGTYFEDLIGSAYPESYIQKEIENELNEALLVNDVINSLSNWSFEKDYSKLIIKFKVNSVYGDFNQEEVMING